MGHMGMDFGGRVVKGAPYTATASSQATQALADGNRIVHSSTATVYRDSEGRTRREETVSRFGPGGGGEPHQVVFINDPVAGFSYVLDPTARTARKMAIHTWAGTGSGSGSGSDSSSAPATASPRHRRAGEQRDLARPNTTREDLGKQSIAGVDADGSRSTFTIGAGEAGNDLAIKVVHERWVSSDLQVVVMSKFSDPRHGETTYQLSNITRGEQSQSLFQVPSDYTVQEGRSHFGPRPRKAAGN